MIRIYRRQSGVDSHTFANEVTTELFGTTIERLPSGKPMLVGSDLHISISHTKEYWAIQSSETRCGIDIELCSRRSEHIARKFTVESEVEICKEVFSQNPTLLIWCAKEALFKWLSEEAVDFREDLKILDATPTTLSATARGRGVELGWYIDGELLIVHTL